MSYVSGSTPTVSGFDTQTPKPLPASAFGKAFQPTAVVVYEKCDRIIVHADTGSCFLLYNTTSSIGTTLSVAVNSTTSASFVGGVCAQSEIGGKVFETMESGSVRPQTIDLPIGAVAFSGSGGFSSANITFIYKGGM